MGSMFKVFCVLVWIACFVTVCFGASPQASAQTSSTKTGLTTTTGTNTNPSLLLALLNSVSATTPDLTNPLPSAPAVSMTPTQTGIQLGAESHFTPDSAKQSFPTIPPVPSNHYQLSGPYPQNQTPPGRGQIPAHYLTPNSFNQQYLREKALLNSYQHTPYNIAVEKGASIAASEQRENMNKLMEWFVLVASAKSLECRTAGELLLGEDMVNIPVECTGRCPRGTSCRNLGPFGVCCPRNVSNLKIQMNALFGPLQL